MSPIATQAHELLARMGVAKSLYTEGTLTARSPVDGAITGRVVEGSAADMQAAIGQAHAAFLAWRVVPAPKRGELVRRFGEVLRATRPIWPRLSRWRPARSPARGPARCRK
jgi:aldehyde dehydrogenase (NAD+)